MKRIVATTLLLASVWELNAQNDHFINWQKPIDNGQLAMLWFEGASSQVQTFEVPSYCGQLFSDEKTLLSIENAVYQSLTQQELNAVEFSEISNNIELSQNTKAVAGGFMTSYCILPIRQNPVSGELEKLVEFSIKQTKDNTVVSSFKTGTAVDSSVLAMGPWYKIAVANTGLYKITPQFLVECGFTAGNLASDQLRVFGNGAGMLSEVNADNPNPELKEVALYVNDGGDGVFNGNDYALFYAVGPHTWEYNTFNNAYRHTFNVYSDLSYYFITINNGVGKRTQNANYAPASANYVVNKFDDFQFIESDKYNLVGSGRRWFGDLFDFKLSYDYTLQFSNVDPSDTAYFAASAVARSLSVGTRMEYRVNNNLVLDSPFLAVTSNSGSEFVRESSDRVPFFPTSNTMQINVLYKNSANTSATAWLDFIEIQLRRNLTLSNNSVFFRDRRAFKRGGVAEYNVSGAQSGMQIWDITNHLDARNVSFTTSGGVASFKAPSDSLRVFVAFTGSSFPAPTKIGVVANQNLHDLENVEMVIISYPDFKVQAEQLAEFHRQTQNLSVVVVTPEMIYNEFSSGMQDITAIKLFLRNIYKKQSAKSLKYCLLFGDASYDYKNRVANMTNFVPIYESPSSFTLYSSYCTDDYYGFLEDHEGKNMLSDNEDIDIAIGRMPVKTVAEAITSINKVFKYKTPKITFDDWRNKIVLVADDVDEGWEMDFLKYTDRLAKELDTIVPTLNIEKIYLDGYVQEVMAGSQRYPEARQDLFRKVQTGNLVTSYLGHGGEVGWATERVLQLTDINGWNNLENMPLFSTITCEFTRVDDPTRISAGEQLFLNPKGGAIALYSTLRPVFATPSTYNINRELFEYMFYKNNGQYFTIGEVIQATKNNNNSGDRIRFTLIGDPAMRIAIPEYNVMTDSINGVAATSFNDTLKALSKVRISGHIEDGNGSFLSEFNGVVNPTVFDKMAGKTTLRNDGAGVPLNFKTRENIIFSGIASVTDGRFSFEFVVPLDISFVIGEGKLSYYATDSVIDANGYYEDFLVGGLNVNAKLDDIGPLVKVFINDTNFVNGGLTNKDPLSIALISDTSGINTVGSGIGHDIIGILDGNTSNPYILNAYFESDLDSYQRGTVRFPFFDLPVGEHTLLIRAWDVNNNPGEGQISFIVDQSTELALKRILNYPNPFNDFTRFQFEHNRAGEPLEIDIQIFDAYGNIVKRITESLVSTGNRVNQITWDGKAEDGSLLSSGVYVYIVQVKSTEDGSVAQGYSKLVYVK